MSRLPQYLLTKLSQIQFTRPYTIEAVARNDIAAIGPTNTTVISITPVFPTGATKVRAYIVATLFIMNDSANAQKITPVLQAQVAGGGYANIWNPGGDIVAVPAADGTSTMVVAEANITNYFNNGQQTDVRWSITQSSANSVHYTSQATIFLVYTV